MSRHTTLGYDTVITRLQPLNTFYCSFDHVVDFAAAQFRQYERLTKQMKADGDEYERNKQKMYVKALMFLYRT